MPDSPSSAPRGGPRNAFVEAGRLPPGREDQLAPAGSRAGLGLKAPSRWLVLLGSAVIVFHLFAVGSRVLAVMSGPWPNPEGIAPAAPPQFAFSISQTEIVRRYLNFLHLTNNFHFNSNRPGQPGVRLEVRLLDQDGNLIDTVRLPSAKANAWVSHREELLAVALGADDMVMPPMGEDIAAPGRKAPTVQIWDMPPEDKKPQKPTDDQQELYLKTIEKHLIPRDRAVFQPSDWSLLLARSYGRRLIREHGAASVEIVRHSRTPYPPAVLYLDSVPPSAFPELITHFPEVKP